MKKLIIGTSLALATLTATPVFAATHHSRISANQPYTVGDSTNAAESGLNVNGPAVISYGQYAGWDPDPNIRFQLMRDTAQFAD